MGGGAPKARKPDPDFKKVKTKFQEERIVFKEPYMKC